MAHYYLRPLAALAVVGGALAPGCSLFDSGEVTEADPLAIVRFVATPTEISSGSTTTLTWEVVGAERIEINNGVGDVGARGNRSVSPTWTTSYTLIARAGSSSATATVQVMVTGQPSPSPSPSPSPDPSPSPTPAPGPSPEPSPGPSPSPDPSPTPEPSPSPSPEPSPSASPTPAPLTCGAPATSAGNCAVSIARPTALAAGECIELNVVNANQSCPVGIGVVRSVRFDVTAHTARAGLRWRRAASNGDVLLPSEGEVASDGATSVVLNDTALDDRLAIEVVDGGQVLLSFTLRHR